MRETMLAHPSIVFRSVNHRQLVVAAVLCALAAPGITLAQTTTIFYNGNVYAVQNDPPQATVVTLSGQTTVTQVKTYHWNNGQGATPGTIALMSDKTGELYGPWQATGQPGQGGVPNAYWVVAPNVTLPPGDYIVIDSDKATWAQNPQSGGAGFVWINGPGGG